MNPKPPFAAPSHAAQLLPPLIFASAVCAALLGARWAWCGSLRFSGLFGNLLLAWIPLVLTLVIQRLRAAPSVSQAWLWFCAVCWFLFFPNAPYIVTDFVHLQKYGKDAVPRWFDLLIIMTHACTGLFVGCVSLCATESLVRARLGRRLGWAFALGMLALASFGIYLGRFLRLNSWDVLVRPGKLITKLAALTQPEKVIEVFAFSVAFFLFSLGAYWFVAAATRLRFSEQENV
jgi:uncharacterized membrane protein